MATKTKKPLTEKQRRKRIILTAIIVTVALIAIGIPGALGYSTYLNSGADSRKTISFESENYKVNNCMMTYFFYSDFYNTYNQYGQYLSYMGTDPLTPTSPMSAQKYNEEQTWYDYFLNTTYSNVQGYLFYAEDAIDAGFEYADLDADIDEQIKALSENAEKEDLNIEEYIVKYYGTAVKEKDIRDALKLQVYALEYYKTVEDGVKDSITEDDFTTYLAENKDTLSMVDYYSFTITSDVADDATEEEKTTASAAAKSKANELLTAVSVEEGAVDAFKSWVTTYLTEDNNVATEPLSEDDLKKQIEEQTSETKGSSKASDSGFSDWAFADDRAVGDANMFEEESNYTVYLMTATSYIDELVSKNVRHILITADKYGSDEEAETKANEILTEWTEGEKTEASFEALAEEYNEDSSSLYENVPKGQMVAEFENWIYDEARAAGDTGVVKTEYGYHIMYFVGDGLEAWKVEAQTALVEKELEAKSTDLQAKYESDLTINTANIFKIPDYLPATAFATTEDTSDDTTADTTEDTSADTTDDTTAESTEDASAESTEDASAESTEDTSAESTEDTAAE